MKSNEMLIINNQTVLIIIIKYSINRVTCLERYYISCDPLHILGDGRRLRTGCAVMSANCVFLLLLLFIYFYIFQLC